MLIKLAARQLWARPRAGSCADSFDRRLPHCRRRSAADARRGFWASAARSSKRRTRCSRRSRSIATRTSSSSTRPATPPRKMDEALELAALLVSHPEIDTHLVLPASMRPLDLARTIDRVLKCFLRNKLIFTTNGRDGILRSVNQRVRPALAAGIVSLRGAEYIPWTTWSRPRSRSSAARLRGREALRAGGRGMSQASPPPMKSSMNPLRGTRGRRTFARGTRAADPRSPAPGASHCPQDSRTVTRERESGRPGSPPGSWD